MTGSDKRIIGVNDHDELLSMRDLLQQLVGRFEQHVDDEDRFHERLEDFMRDEPERVQAVVQREVGACRAERELQLAPAVAAFESIKAQTLDQRAVKHWLSDKAKRGIVLAVFGALVVATLLLATSHDREFAGVTALLAIITPFVMLLWRRG